MGGRERPVSGPVSDQGSDPLRGRADPSAESTSDYTVDAFHFGRFWLVQPARGAHRAGMDAMLLAATVPGNAEGRLADLGAGAGAAGLAAAARVPAIAVTLVERSPVMADFARRSLALENNVELAARAAVVEADVTLTGAARRAAGLADEAHDFVIMNPPFNKAEDRRTPDRLKAEAHAMDHEDLFDRWLRTAGAILKPGGQLSVIARPESLAALLAAAEGRFGGAEITPVHPRKGDDAIRILLTAIKGSRAHLLLRPPIFIHEEKGHAFAPEMNAFNNGTAEWPRRRPSRR